MLTRSRPRPGSSCTPTQDSPDTVAALQYFLTYLLSEEGQALAQELDYAPLPSAIRDLAIANVAKIGA